MASLIKHHIYKSVNDQLVQDLAKDLGEVRPIELQIVGYQLETEKITTREDYRKYESKEELVEAE
ncbi:MAG: hypothetical protein RIE73_38230 [Coleofasciculus sp. C1-SOL-03]